MAVQVQAKGQGGITAGGNLSLGQLSGSPAMSSAILVLLLLAVIVLIAMSLR